MGANSQWEPHVTINNDQAIDIRGSLPDGFYNAQIRGGMFWHAGGTAAPNDVDDMFMGRPLHTIAFSAGPESTACWIRRVNDTDTLTVSLRRYFT